MLTEFSVCIMDSAFAPINMHAGMNMMFPVVQPDNPMNAYYLDQARQYAQRNPHDQHAQALYMHWLQSLQNIEAARVRMQQHAGVPGGQMPAQAQPVPVPSNLTAAPTAPTPPMSAAQAPTMDAARASAIH